MLRKTFLSIAMAASVTSIPAASQNAEYELVKVITERQGLMFDMQTAYWTVFNVNSGKETDLAKAAEAAQTINDAIDQFVQLLPPGTAHGDVFASRAKPEIWTEPDEFNGAVSALKSANKSLMESARSGNIDEFKQRFEAVAQACVGCHELRPSRGGKFRYEASSM